MPSKKTHCNHRYSSSVQYVTTSTELEALRTGKIGFGIETISVEATAQTNVLILPKYFWSYPYNAINFTDTKRNQVTIRPNERAAFAVFRAGRALSIGLPIVFRSYEIDFLGQATIDATDVESMLGWKYAERLAINDEHDLISRLADRMDDMKAMAGLKSFSLNVHRSSYRRLRVRTFLDALPALETATFVTKRAWGLSDEQFEEFLKGQTIPEKWTQMVNDVGVTYTLKRAEKEKESLIKKIINFFKKLFNPK